MLKRLIAMLLLSMTLFEAHAAKNVAPTVTMTATLTVANAPGTIVLSGTASDSDGSIAKVEFFSGTTLLSTVTQAPYGYTWSNVAAGSYSLTARATDNRGSATTTQPSLVTVLAGIPKVHYVYADQVNTAREITNSAGALVWRADATEPFGSNLPNENPSSLGTFNYNLRFPGQYFDFETLLHYNYFRDYDPQTGRFIQSDPIGLGGGLNTFAYVGDNPVIKVDSDGLQACVPMVTPFGPACLPVPPPIIPAVPQPKPDAIPGAANDAIYGGGGNCPPDCEEFRRALNRTYIALTMLDKVSFDMFTKTQTTLQWAWFWLRVKEYEKDCGPWTPPPTDIHEIYGR